VHTVAELHAALDAGAAVIGVNSRDLDTFRIDTAAAWKLVHQVPPDRIAVAESGMAGPGDVVRVAEAGADAVLIGTALSAAPSPERLLGEVSAIRRHDR
jgi:indole-3-glycerol phosphate synthase